MNARLLKLEDRGVIRLKGTDGNNLLQGLITNDMALLETQAAVYAALLTPQGKFLFDMVITKDGDDILLDIEAERKPQLIQRLMMYKLRADVEIIDESASVWALWGAEAENGVAFTDPRHKALKLRVIADQPPVAKFEALSKDNYNERRIRHGVPNGSEDMLIEKYFWLETAAEKLNGVSFTKGCYVGQELTARMKHRTTLKKMLVPVKISGAAENGAAIKTDNGKNAGTLHSSAGGYAISYMRLEYLNADLVVNGTDVTVTPLQKEQ